MQTIQEYVPASVKLPRRSSAVSQILRALKNDLDTGAKTDAWPLHGGPSAFKGRVLVANTDAVRHRAWRMAYRVYSSCGYVPPDPNGMITSAFDASPTTFTLLVEDEHGREAATVTLVFDSENNLPCDEIFAPELTALRGQGRKLVEVTRLAIDEAHTGSKQLLVVLFNFIFVFARRIRGFDDFVIEVNPRHVNYYRRLLLFEVAGSERPCPRVNGAPAVLLRVDLGSGEREVRRVGGHGDRAQERTLFPHFYAWKEECVLSKFLESHIGIT